MMLMQLAIISHVKLIKLTILSGYSGRTQVRINRPDRLFSFTQWPRFQVFPFSLGKMLIIGKVYWSRKCMERTFIVRPVARDNNNANPKMVNNEIDLTLCVTE